MYRKCLAFFLTVMLLTTIFACVPASADTKVTLKNKVSYDDGYTTIKWDVEGDDLSKYVVFVEVVDNGSAKQQTVRVGETSKHSIKCVDMIPGKSYEVTVTNSAFSILDQKTYTLPEADEFENGKMTTKSVKITLDPMRLKSGANRAKQTKKVKNLVASDIESGIEDGDWLYGVKYTMKMPQLAKGREFFTTIAFEAPNGFLWTVIAQDVEFQRVNNGYQTVWFYMIGDTFFETMYKATGEIPTGTYKVYLFWDGMWVNTSKVKIK